MTSVSFRVSYIAALLLLLLSMCKAQESPPRRTSITWSADTSYFSAYVWRGFEDYNGGSWQNTFRLGWKSVQASWWLESGMQHDGLMEAREHDFDLHLTRRFRGNSLSAGYTAYCVLLTDNTSHEIYATLSKGTRYVGTLGVYQSIGAPDGTYFSGTLTHSLKLNSGWDLELASSLGFNRRMYIDASTFSDATLNVTFVHPTRSGIALSPAFGVSKGLDSRHFYDHIYAGVTLHFGND